MTKTRIESDSFGPIEVPVDRLWGAQTKRSRRNFSIGEERMPKPIIRALGIVKRAAAEVNHQLGLLDARRTKAIVRAAQEVIAGGVRPPGTAGENDSAGLTWIERSKRQTGDSGGASKHG
jgi:fumarate hydratase class II